MSYCAPNTKAYSTRDKTCFTLDSLQKLAKAWNRIYGGDIVEGGSTDQQKSKKIKNILKKNKKELWNDINQRMKERCKANGNEGCWVDKLQMEEESEPYQDLRPPTPMEWYKNPRTWLTNFDIEDVMEQYEMDQDNKYHFLGVFPMDFADIYTELSEIRWSHITRNNRCKYIGMITNLDDHDEPGSHWTSFFACLDKTLPSYGGYYYDSVSSPPTKEIKEFMLKLMKRSMMEDLRKKYTGVISAEDILSLDNYTFIKNTDVERKTFLQLIREICKKYSVKPPREFQLSYNTHQHQYKNTECGMFSMIYQIRWIEGLRKDKNTTFDKIISHRMNDDEVYRLRAVLYRPNTVATVGGSNRKRLNK